MGIAYMTTSDAKATTVMSRLPPKTSGTPSVKVSATLKKLVRNVTDV